MAWQQEVVEPVACNAVLDGSGTEAARAVMTCDSRSELPADLDCLTFQGPTNITFPVI